MKNQKSGFTLAEVLITMSIIGIIAAIIMPALLTSYQYKSLGVKLSKFLSTTEQTARAYVVSNDALRSSDADEIKDMLDFINDSFLFTEVSSDDKDKKEYLGIENPTDEQLARTYAYGDGTDARKTMVSFYSNTANVNKELKSVKDGGSADDNVAVLKDGTRVAFAPVESEEYTIHTTAVDTAKIGLPALNITVTPKVAGLPSSVQKKYNFIVTELGYVVPNDYDTCLWEIYNAEWKTTSKMFAEDMACNKNGKVGS